MQTAVEVTILLFPAAHVGQGRHKEKGHGPDKEALRGRTAEDEARQTIEGHARRGQATRQGIGHGKPNDVLQADTIVSLNAATTPNKVLSESQDVQEKATRWAAI